MDQLSLLQKIAIWALPVLFAITVHEVAHGWIASKLGDKTAKRLGRITLNPFKHIDPIGTVIVPLILLWLGGFIFGWARPVPVAFQNLNKPRRDMILVAVAGPMANLLMAFFWAIIAKVGIYVAQAHWPDSLPIFLMGMAGITINLMLMVLNLLPIPPLDGGRVLSGLLPGPWSAKLDRVEPWGFWILLALIYFGILWRIIGPIILLLLNTIIGIFGLTPQS